MITTSAFVVEFLKLFLFLHLHWGVLAGGAVLLNKLSKLPAELFRKMLHFAAVFAIIPIVLPATTWATSAAVCIAFALESYLGARFSNMQKDIGMKERSDGEQQRSMLLLFGTYLVLILIGWGALGQQWIPVLSVVAWGVGDAFAALVGKKFGRHKIQGKWIEGKKSIEGTLAMFATSFAATFLLYRHHTIITNPALTVLVCFWIALFACITELLSRKGMDTVFCPLSSMLGLMILNFAAGGI